MDEALLTSVVSHLRRNVPGLVAVYVFGSAVHDGLRPDSDLDVALLLRPGAVLPAEQRLGLTADLTAIAARPVDLSVLGGPGGTILGREVVTTGRRVWDDGSRAVPEFEMYALSAYARLREDRAPVEAAYSLADGR